jgi:hypothetical protein
MFSTSSEKVDGIVLKRNIKSRGITATIIRNTSSLKYFPYQTQSSETIAPIDFEY